MAPRRGSGEIIIAGQRFKTDVNVVNFADPPYWDASKQTCIPLNPGQAVRCGSGGMPFAPAKGISKPVRSRPRRIDQKTDRTLKVAQSYLRQFVIHLDGCRDADMCWDVLQNERGLSCHFILDNDGTLYQTLDLIDCAYHAAGLNESSIGIEISNRGNAGKEPHFYDASPYKRDVVTCFVHGEKYVAFDFTKEQYATMIELAKFCGRMLPGIKMNQPIKDGAPVWTTLVDELKDPTGRELRETYVGYLGHYHITKQKWDPGPFDFKKMLGQLRGRSSFPLGLHELAKKNDVPDNPEALARATKEFYANNEEKGGGGYFPVGSLPPYRLWHGGVHLHVPEGEKVYAPWGGQVVAARNVNYQPGIGSVNFVLIKHAFAVKGENLDFYTLYFHLRREAEETARKDRLRWMANESWDARDPASLRPVVFDPPVPVQAGDVVGYVGKAGPEEEPQVHFEIFFLDITAFRRLDKAGFWTVLASEGKRFCVFKKEILDPIDTKKPKGRIDLGEVQDFFREPSVERDLMRQIVSLHPSEWSNTPDWKTELLSEPELAKKARDVKELVDEQIVPTLWWEEAASKLHLGSSDVYTVHPITFMRWVNDMLNAEKAAGSGDVKVATAADLEDARAGRTGKALSDYDDASGESFANEEDRREVAPDRKLEIEDIIEGFGD